MPRLRQVGRDAAHPLAQTIYKMLFGERDPVAEPGTETGTPGNWWTVFALVPDVFDHAVQFDDVEALDAELLRLGEDAEWLDG